MPPINAVGTTLGIAMVEALGLSSSLRVFRTSVTAANFPLPLLSQIFLFGDWKHHFKI